MQKENRRSFVKKAGIASTIAAGQFLNLNPSAIGANEKIVLALVGGHNQGSHDAKHAIDVGAEIKTICDIDDEIIQKCSKEFKEKQNKALTSTKDFRDVFDDKDIDGVIIATPDHWHSIPTILACQAGKDVYIEKPLSHTIHEGHLMRNAARKYDRIVQVGTQRRSANHFKSAVEYVNSGELGKICMMKAWMCQVRGSVGNPPNTEVPEGVDYDKWLGPAPEKPFNKNRFHYTWRFFWDYCNSELGNQGVHMLDIAMWAIEMERGLENSLPTHVSGQTGIYWLDDAKEVPDTQVTTYDFGDFTLVWELRSFARHHPIEGTNAGTGFYGTDGILIVTGSGWQVYQKDGEKGPSEKKSGGSHMKNFLDCIKSRKKPNADVEIGRISTTICHLGNIITHLGRDVVFDPKTETFGNDKEASEYLSKEYREPYTLPSI